MQGASRRLGDLESLTPMNGSMVAAYRHTRQRRARRTEWLALRPVLGLKNPHCPMPAETSAARSGPPFTFPESISCLGDKSVE